MTGQTSQKFCQSIGSLKRFSTRWGTARTIFRVSSSSVFPFSLVWTVVLEAVSFIERTWVCAGPLVRSRTEMCLSLTFWSEYCAWTSMYNVSISLICTVIIFRFRRMNIYVRRVFYFVEFFSRIMYDRLMNFYWINTLESWVRKIPWDIMYFHERRKKSVTVGFLLCWRVGWRVTCICATCLDVILRVFPPPSPKTRQRCYYYIWVKYPRIYFSATFTTSNHVSYLSQDRRPMLVASDLRQ